jgi:hypothetical protein
MDNNQAHLTDEFSIRYKSAGYDHRQSDGRFAW